MISQLLIKLMNPALDDSLVQMLTQDYPTNPFIMATVAEKLTTKAIIEAGIRAELGKELSLPYGSPLVLSQWEKILFNPRQLFQLPTEHLEDIKTRTVIGPHTKRPLVLDIPIMITAMSYGGSLNLEIKMALAKGAAMAGTSTNTGESTVTNEERDAAKFLIGQFNRGGWLTSKENLQRVDAIEVQLGQGAFGGAVKSTVKADQIGDHLRDAWHVDKGTDASVHSRMPGINSPQDIVNLINELKEHYDVPVGIKICGTDFIEYELEVIAKTNSDFITVDGAEGGTAAAPPTLTDNVGLPTLHTLVRTVDWLNKNNLREKFSLIAAGGLKTPGDFLKAIALGADAVYIGSIALIAAIQTQITKALPQLPPTQLALYGGSLTDKLDIDKAAENLTNFLNSCVSEMKLVVQATGKNAIKDLNKDDLVTVDKELSKFLSIRYAASHRKDNDRKF